MTITELLKDLPTLDQIEVMQRADRLLSHCGGRYYGGLLTKNDLKFLLPKKDTK